MHKETYVLNSPTEEQFKEYKEVILDYIWNGKRPKISYDILIGKREQGGLKLCDLKMKDRALKIQWIKRIRNKNSSLSNLAYYFLPKMGEYIWKCNLNPYDVDKILPINTFWRDVLKAWGHYNFTYPLEKENICNNIIWYNSHILIDNKPIFYKKCFEGGVV